VPSIGAERPSLLPLGCEEEGQPAGWLLFLLRVDEARGFESIRTVAQPKSGRRGGEGRSSHYSARQPVRPHHHSKGTLSLCGRSFHCSMLKVSCETAPPFAETTGTPKQAKRPGRLGRCALSCSRVRPSERRSALASSCSSAVRSVTEN